MRALVTSPALLASYQKKSYMPLGEIRAVFLPIEYVSAFAADMDVGHKIAVS